MKTVDAGKLDKAVDKLGEEIAFDINSIETQLKEHVRRIDDLQSKSLELHQKCDGLTFQFNSRPQSVSQPNLPFDMDKLLKKMVPEDLVKHALRSSLKDIKYQQKKQREDQMKMLQKYDNIKQKMKDQNRLLEKIRLNSWKRHSNRSNSRNHDMAQVSRRSFQHFVAQLHQTFLIVFHELEQAFSRDSKLTQSLYDSHFNTSGNMLTVRKEVNELLRNFKQEVIQRGFNKPVFLPYQECEDFPDALNKAANVRTSVTYETVPDYQKRSELQS